MLCFGGVGQSVGGSEDKVMGRRYEEERCRSCDGEDCRREKTYAFFAQLNMIAGCDLK